jgi:hypothetical protein
VCHDLTEEELALEVYLVTPDMAQILPGESATVTLFTTVNRQGTFTYGKIQQAHVLERFENA